jgi:putative chitinase
MAPDQLVRAIGCSIERAIVWAPALSIAMQKFGIDSKTEIATFLAQVCHESAHLTRLTENLNYSALGLATVWPSRYLDRTTGQPNSLAWALHRRPAAIANNCYANRMGNRDEASGDGWRYLGRGPIMITGAKNYDLCGKAIKVDLLNKPELLLEPEYGALAAGWFWYVNKLDAHDDDYSLLRETKIINGGTTGLVERQALFNNIIKGLA